MPGVWLWLHKKSLLNHSNFLCEAPTVSAVVLNYFHRFFDILPFKRWSQPPHLTLSLGCILILGTVTNSLLMAGIFRSVGLTIPQINTLDSNTLGGFMFSLPASVSRSGGESYPRDSLTSLPSLVILATLSAFL